MIHTVLATFILTQSTLIESLLCSTRTEFPNLFAEERRDILVGMKAPATSGEKSEVVLRVKVTYFDVIARRSTEANIDVVLRRRRTVIAKIKNPLVEVTDLRFKASEVRLEVLYVLLKDISIFTMSW